MPTSAKLTDLVDALEGQSDSICAFLDRETGEVILMTDESLLLAQYEPEAIQRLHGWQQEEAQLAKDIETTDRYLALPDRFEVNEWEIMRDFCDEVRSDHAKTALQDAIHGNHAFRRTHASLAGCASERAAGAAITLDR